MSTKGLEGITTIEYKNITLKMKNQLFIIIIIIITIIFCLIFGEQMEPDIISQKKKASKKAMSIKGLEGITFSSSSWISCNFSMESTSFSSMLSELSSSPFSDTLGFFPLSSTIFLLEEKKPSLTSDASLKP